MCYYRIKFRHKKKHDPLSTYLRQFTDVITAAWPSKCDATGFDYDPAFRLPSANHLDDTTIRCLEPALQSVLNANNPCSSCWECSCGALQNMTHAVVQEQVENKNKDERLHQTRCLTGKLQQTMTDHWDMEPCKFNDLVSTLRTDKSELNREQCVTTKLIEQTTFQQTQMGILGERNKELEDKLTIMIETETSRNKLDEDLQAITSYATGQEVRLLQIQKTVCDQCVEKCEKEQLFNA